MTLIAGLQQQNTFVAEGVFSVTNFVFGTCKALITLIILISHTASNALITPNLYPPLSHFLTLVIVSKWSQNIN